MDNKMNNNDNEIFRSMWSLQMKLRSLLSEYANYLQLFRSNPTQLSIKSHMKELLVQIKSCGEEQNKIIDQISEPIMNGLAEESQTRLSLLLDPLRKPEIRQQCDRELNTVSKELLRNSGTQKVLFTREVGLQLVNSDNSHVTLKSNITNGCGVFQTNSPIKKNLGSNKRKTGNCSNCSKSQTCSKCSHDNDEEDQSASTQPKRHRLTMSSGTGRSKKSLQNTNKLKSNSQLTPYHQLIDSSLLMCCGICHCLYEESATNHNNSESKVVSINSNNNNIMICRNCQKNIHL